MPALVVGIISLKGCTAFSLLVPRITLEAYLASPVYTSPVLIRDIVSSETIELLADTLMNSLGTETVSMQRKIKKRNRSKRSKSSTTEIYDIALQHSIDYMMDSCHDDSYFAFCEGLLPSNSLHDNRMKLSNELKNIREAPFANQENWFDYFPASVQPTDAIILAGTGSTSTLHRDPFEWTGTSLCLEGSKIWRFILPPQNSLESNGGGVAIVDEALKSYRLNSIAWEDDDEVEHNHGDIPVILSAGWQSDMTLYDSIDELFPSGFELMELEEEDNEKFERELEATVLNKSRLRPSNDALDALDQIAQSYDTSNHPSPFITAIQRQGDLLIIPAHCWHQTYAPVPSVAVASQRCGATVDGANVIEHVLGVSTNNCDEEHIEIPDLLKQNHYTEGMGRGVVAALLQYVTSTR